MKTRSPHDFTITSINYTLKTLMLHGITPPLSFFHEKKKKKKKGTGRNKERVKGFGGRRSQENENLFSSESPKKE